MKFSKLITKTMRAEPSEVETPSHRLMVKAGMVQQVASGVYAYLPLAWRSLRKIESIIREEMDSSGGQEIRMPVLQPQEMWDESGRNEAFGDNLFRLKDRRGRGMVMAPTHEEVLSYLVKNHVQSYRDLPAIVYQIQTKFRDEPRPRGGLIRVREFDMKDAYSLDRDEEGLEYSYQLMVTAYKNIYRKCGLPALMVEADSGAIGGKDSHEFILPISTGEDTIITCDHCGYAANSERAESAKSLSKEESLKPLEEVPTPELNTILGLAEYFDIPKSRIIKSTFYVVDEEVLLVAIRGDLNVNEVKLKNSLGAHDIALAKNQEVDGIVGSVGRMPAINSNGVRSIIDTSISTGYNFMAVSDNPGCHLKNVNYPRDFSAGIVADIAQASDGHQCVNCGSLLSSVRGIEVGHIFKLGAFFSDMLGVHYLDATGTRQSVVMGCYGIGVGRLLAAAIEQNHDERGILFPRAIAPYQIHLVGLNLDIADVSSMADNLYKYLWDQGFECLYDDRLDETAGVKFNDADLLGLPIRLVASKRNLESQVVEMFLRESGTSTLVPLDEVRGVLADKLSS